MATGARWAARSAATRRWPLGRAAGSAVDVPTEQDFEAKAATDITDKNVDSKLKASRPISRLSRGAWPAARARPDGVARAAGPAAIRVARRGEVAQLCVDRGEVDDRVGIRRR